MKALSLRQPWADAVLYGGKRIENRVAWSNSKFRGEFLIHAAKGCTRKEYADAWRFMVSPPNAIGTRIEWRPRPLPELARGAIVGRGTVVGVVRPGIPRVERAGHFTLDEEGERARSRAMTDREWAWWMGGFALVLEDVVAFERPIPWPGKLGFFSTPFDRHGRRGS